MPTPTSGTISMLDMRNEITRGSGAISMDEVRTRYGGSGAISFSDLYKTEGFVITCGQQITKFVTYNGWNTGGGGLGFTFGSVSPNESNGRVQFASASFLNGVVSVGATPAVITITPDNSGSSTNGDNVTAGFKTTNISRVVMANVARTINSATSNSTTSGCVIAYEIPSSGTIAGLLKF